MPWRFGSAILFNKHSEIQMFIWISGPTETRFCPSACPGAVLSLFDSKEPSQVAQQENRDGEKGPGFSPLAHTPEVGVETRRCTAFRWNKSHPTYGACKPPSLGDSSGHPGPWKRHRAAFQGRPHADIALSSLDPGEQTSVQLCLLSSTWTHTENLLGAEPFSSRIHISLSISLLCLWNNLIQ